MHVHACSLKIPVFLIVGNSFNLEVEVHTYGKKMLLNIKIQELIYDFIYNRYLN